MRIISFVLAGLMLSIGGFTSLSVGDDITEQPPTSGEVTNAAVMDLFELPESDELSVAGTMGVESGTCGGAGSAQSSKKTSSSGGCGLCATPQTSAWYPDESSTVTPPGGDCPGCNELGEDDPDDDPRVP
jgi:putative hemolysin